MKKKIFLSVLSITTLSMSLGGVLFFSSYNKESKEADASSYVVNTVPTTLNLGDTSESDIRSYYSSLNALDTSERQGTNLLKNLKPILKNGQKYFSYTASATTAIWKAYEIVDRDWESSPVEDIINSSKETYISGASYNPSTKILTGYVYGTSVNSKGSNPYLHTLYVNRDATNEARAWEDHSQKNYGFNQEHIWAKSLGFESTPYIGARGDLMHLWAGNGKVNGQYHSNYYYGYVDTNRDYADAGNDYSYLTGNLRGYSRSMGGNTTVFEPQDSDKGDIARAIFYMAARYNYYSGSDTDGIDSGNPNLEIVNNVTSWQNSGYASTTTTTGKMGVIQDLLEWNRLDPPDEWEIHRNNLCYNNFTNNRNPFIDFPEWAEYIWGSSTEGEYDSTVTGYATPSSDTLNTLSGGVVTGDDVLTIAKTGVNSNNYTDFSGITSNSSAVYAGKCAKGNNAIQLNNTNPYGVVQTTSGGYVSNVTIAWNSNTVAGRTVDVYGKNTAYTSGADLYANATRGTKLGSIVYGTSTSLDIDGDYEYLAFRSNSGVLYLDSVTISYKDVMTSITATTKKTFKVGETISKSDITVKGNDGTEIDDFTFTNNGYRFTFADADSGGTLTNKEFPVSYSTLEKTFNTTLTVKVRRVTYTTVEDTLNKALTGVTGNSYTEWSDKSSNSGAVYAGLSAGGNSSIQIRTDSSNSGVVTTDSGGTIRKVTITWESHTTSGRTLNIYGKNTAYEAATDLFSAGTQGTLLGSISYDGTNAEGSINVTGDTYTYIGFRSKKDPMYISSVVIEFAPVPSDLAHYIMFEDTSNQCETKLDVAKGYFEKMTKADRAVFMTSEDYMISTARTRLLAWATNQGKSITLSGGDYVITANSLNDFVLFDMIENSNNNNSTWIIVIAAFTGSMLSCLLYFCLRKRSK